MTTMDNTKLHLTPEQISNLDQNKATIDEILDVLVARYRHLLPLISTDLALMFVSQTIKTHQIVEDREEAAMMLARAVSRLAEAPQAMEENRGQ